MKNGNYSICFINQIYHKNMQFADYNILFKRVRFSARIFFPAKLNNL